MNLLKFASVILITTLPVYSFALPDPSGASDEPAGSQKPLQVNGQSRNINMMLVLRNDKDKIKFVHPRENYRDEIAQENSVQEIVPDAAVTSIPTKEGKN